MQPENSNLALLDRVFLRTVGMHRPGRPAAKLEPGTHLNAWDWGPGIAFYGLQRAYPLLDPARQAAYCRFWREWLAANLDRQPPTPAINGAIMLNVLWKSVHDRRMPFSPAERQFYREYCLERVEYGRRQAHRVASGAFAHTVAGGSPASSRQVWADNLVMLVLLLAAVAASLGDKDLFAEQVRQVELHYRLLSDPATGLLFHGWQDNSQGGSHLNGARWGRGNAWAALGVIELLELARDTPGFEIFQDQILRPARPQFEALLARQTSNAGWHTLLDQPWSYLETSITAGLAAAFLKGARLEALGSEFERSGRRALAALKASISPAGDVTGVSGSTPLLDSLAAYNEIPHDTPVTWGQGLALLALVEDVLS